MGSLAEDFSRFADSFAEALLLVTSAGEIAASNRAARALLFGGTAPAAGDILAAYLADPADRITGYLRLCSRSGGKLPARLTLLNGAARGGRTLLSEGWAWGPNGAERLVMLRLVPREDSLQRFTTLNRQVEALQREVTRRLHAERIAQEQREMLRVTLTSIGDAVITTDTTGLIAFMNPVAERLTGWDMSEAAGRPLAEVFVIRHEETGAEVESPVAEVLRHGGVVGLANHTVLIRRDGKPIPIDDSGAPIRDSAGRLFGVVLVFHEISERRAMERRLRQQTEALREADRRKDEFLAMLAHELRNPLAPLHSAVQILKLRANEDDITKLTALMERQTAQLTRLVDDLLDIARITRGAIQLQREPVSVAGVLEHAVETVKPLIDARNHQLRVTLPSEPITVKADFMRLSQVFCNLLNNATKFMDAGGEIDLEAFAEGEEVVVKVRDRGRGMDHALLARIFDLFIQADRSLDRREGGLGVGLTLVKTLVQMHGGEISAASAGPGRGSEFTVRLPAARPGLRANEEPAIANGAVDARVLVVDDNADAAESLQMLLSHWGCEVVTAKDGPEALEMARSQPPDVVLLDIGLPQMDGYEVARRMRELPGMGAARIVAVTGYGRDTDRARADEAGFDMHLTKPVKLDDLRAVLQRRAPLP